MNTRTGGTKVKGGFYWDKAEWEMTVVPAEGGTLPGGSDRRYLRVPVVALLLLGPIMGALFVVFLPVIGVYLLAKNLYRIASETTARAFHSMSGQRVVIEKGPAAGIRAGKFPAEDDDGADDR